MSAVDEFGAATRKLTKDPYLTTKSVVERRFAASPSTERRVVSAGLSRFSGANYMSGPSTRAKSATASMAVVDSSSLGQNELVSCESGFGVSVAWEGWKLTR